MKMMRIVLVALLLVGLAPLASAAPADSTDFGTSGFWTSWVEGVVRALDAVADLLGSLTDAPETHSSPSIPDVDEPPTPEGYPWAEPVG